METITFKIEREVDFYNIISVLDEMQIPHSTKKYSDSAFPFLGQSRVYAEISVDPQYGPAVKDVIEGKTEVSTPQKDNMGPEMPAIKKTDKLKLALIIYAVLATALLIKYWHMSYIYTHAKNFTYDWSLDNSTLYMNSKETGRTIQASYDNNYDLNFEDIRYHSKKGAQITRFSDFNEDGYFEEIEFFNQQGASTGRQFDSDNNGISERMEIELESGETLIFTDKNQDGTFEKDHNK
jgi:hypothetical protein